MAYIDYGVLIKKNKQIIKEHDDMITLDNGINVGFYYLNITIGNNEDYHKDLWFRDLESYTAKYPYEKYRMKKNIYGIKIDSKRIDNKERYYTIIKYKNDLYEVIHGWGIDENFDLIYSKTNKLMSKLNRFMRDTTNLK